MTQIDTDNFGIEPIDLDAICTTTFLEVYEMVVDILENENVEQYWNLLPFDTDATYAEVVAAVDNLDDALNAVLTIGGYGDITFAEACPSACYDECQGNDDDDEEEGRDLCLCICITSAFILGFVHLVWMDGMGAVAHRLVYR